METETIAAIVGSVVGGSISLVTTAWFQAVKTRKLDREKFRTYTMELSLVMNALSSNLLSYEELGKEVKKSLLDCASRKPLTPVSHDFSLDQLDASSMLLPSLTDDYSLILKLRSVLWSLRVMREKVRLAKEAMAFLGVEQSQAYTNLKLVKDELEKNHLLASLTSTHALFSDAFCKASGQLEVFNEENGLLKYLFERG